ncbi:MAG TPA: SNF2-related protein [Synergistaceae bacterium]|nr:SNF2-related protein [Synergistaceae bacterium]
MTSYKTETLVHARGRDWVVLPSEREDLLRLKPLDGREEDVRGIFLPLAREGEIRPSQFGPPTGADLGSARAARLLFDASRLSLRSAAGPFRCAAKLGFRPRSYQMVPLVMALKQREGIRLLLADDVGIGKTIEALLIARELLERREIRRFAVLCPPHLCEQWQTELKEKFGIDATRRKSPRASSTRTAKGSRRRAERKRNAPPPPIKGRGSHFNRITRAADRQNSGGKEPLRRRSEEPFLS